MRKFWQFGNPAPAGLVLPPAPQIPQSSLHRKLPIMSDQEESKPIGAVRVLGPMIAGYLAGDRGSTLLEWMEGKDWEKLFAFVAEVAKDYKLPKGEQPRKPAQVVAGWTPLTESIRREMLARFSGKLSMEEIASCAYAVAALEDRQEAASVPEGVQGKEPQTFDEFWAVKQPFDGDSPVGAKFWARKSWAAGRRSAITELQETVADWGRRSRDAFFVEACVWCLKKCAELQEKTK